MLLENPLKGKSFREILDAAVIPTIVVLVGIGSFGLGRLSSQQPLSLEASQHKTPIIHMEPAKMVASPTLSQTSGTYVASKNGSKYYLPSCSGANAIKEGNKIWFDTVEDAIAAGYTAAANCKGI